MADKPEKPSKASIVVKNMSVKQAFDKKYVSCLPKVMKAAAAKAIDASSVMTTDKPADDKAKVYSLDATLTALTQSASGIDAKMSMALSEDNHMFGFLNGGTSVSHPNLKKLDSEVEELVSGLVKALIDDKVEGAVKAKVSK